NIIILDVQGKLVCSARPFAREAFEPRANEPWFEKTLHERTSVLSEPRIGQISRKWISSYSHPILDARGQPAGGIAFGFYLLDSDPVKRVLGLSGGVVAGIDRTLRS